MNKKGFVGVIVLLLLLAVVGGVIYVVNKPSSPTGSVVGTPSNYNPNNPYNIPEYKNTGKGDYGQQCLDDGYCDSGECQGGMCVHCGYFGETCCYNDVTGTQCERGSECYLGRCRATDEYTQDCGHVGYKPCYYNENVKCYYGVYNSYLDICEACGDYEQPCCLETIYECDYGQCVNGRCKRVDSTSSNSASNNGPNPQDYPIDQQNNQQYTNTNEESCGKLNQDCCQDINSLSPMGVYSAKPACESGLECYSGVCVNGPEYETYQR